MRKPDKLGRFLAEPQGLDKQWYILAAGLGPDIKQLSADMSVASVFHHKCPQWDGASASCLVRRAPWYRYI